LNTANHSSDGNTGGPPISPLSGVRGHFVTFEGGEGAGKSTQIELMAERLRAAGADVVVTREPGGSPGAEIIRHLVLSGVGKALGADAEALLFAAARDDHVQRIIEPALRRGCWVLCDRFLDSTRVYQGKLGEADLGLIKAMERITIGELQPDLTIVLDVPAEVGLARARMRRGAMVADRFEAEDIGYHRRLRDAFRQITIDDPARCVLVPADAEIEVVAERVWTAVVRKFGSGAGAANLAVSGA
jgi:dTMP kinase